MRLRDRQDGAAGENVGSVATGALAAPPPETVTELTTVPGGPATFTVSAIGLPDAPAAIDALEVQVAVCPEPLQVQPVPLAALKVNPGGSVSTTVSVPDVAAVPVLLTAIVYVPVQPMLKLPVCDFAIASTGRTIVVGSFATGEFGAPPPEALALFVSDGGALGDTFTLRVMGLPLAPAAMTVVLVHVTTAPAAEHVQPVPLAEKYDKPVGSVSLTVIVPEVATLPLLLTRIVYVPRWPAMKFPVCDFVMPSVGLPLSVVGSVATGELVAPPPLAVTELVTLPGGPPTLTVSVIGCLRRLPRSAWNSCRSRFVRCRCSSSRFRWPNCT